jgi:hypothetical protein
MSFIKNRGNSALKSRDKNPALEKKTIVIYKTDANFYHNMFSIFTVYYIIWYPPVFHVIQ